MPDGQKLARSPRVGETGIDDLYKVSRADVDYVVVEYKFVGSGTGKGSTRLGETADGKQGSESWITGGNRIEKATQSSQIADAIRDSIDNGRIESWVVTARPDGSTVVEVLDASGKPKIQLGQVFLVELFRGALMARASWGNQDYWESSFSIGMSVLGLNGSA